MMKLIFTLAAFLITSAVFGQGIYNKAATNIKQNRMMVDSVLGVPRDTTATNLATYLTAQVGDSGRLAWHMGRFWGHTATGWKGFAYSDDVPTGATLQTVTTNGNTTNVNSIFNGGINAATNLDLGLITTSRVRMNRFVDLIGNTTGSANGAFISFLRSDASRVGALGDGSSLDNDMYFSALDSNNIRFSFVKEDTALAPSTLTAVMRPDGATLFNHTAPTYDPGVNKISVNGNAEVVNTLALSSQVEFKRTGSNFKVSVGYLGNPEANISANMNYTNSIHEYYDNTRAAMWMALAPGAGDVGAWAIQYAPSGLATDIWTNSPFPYYVRQDRNEMRVYNKLRTDSGLLVMQPPSQYRFRIRRTDQAQGLELSAGSGRLKFNNYDSANSVFPNYEYLSTKGSVTKVLAFMHGNNGSMSVGYDNTTTPTSILSVNGDADFTDGTAKSRLYFSSNVGLIGTSTSHPFGIVTNGVEVARYSVGGAISMPGVVSIGNTSRVVGNNTGSTNLATMGVYLNDGTTRIGYFGDGSTSNQDVYMVSDVGGIELNAASNQNIRLFTQAGGAVQMTNTTANLFYYNNAGTGAPTVTTRSAGMKIVVGPTLSGSLVDAGIGMFDANTPYLSMAGNTNAYAWRVYGGTAQVASINGVGDANFSGSITSSKGSGTGIRSTAVSTAITADDGTLIVTAGGTTITLPTASTVTGRIFRIIMDGPFTATITSVRKVGVGTTTVASGATWTIQSNGTNYYVIAN